LRPPLELVDSKTFTDGCPHPSPTGRRSTEALAQHRPDNATTVSGRSAEPSRDAGEWFQFTVARCEDGSKSDRRAPPHAGQRLSLATVHASGRGELAAVANPVANIAINSNDHRVLIRREQPGDVDAVRAIVAAAFARPDEPDQTPVEVGLLDGLRSDNGWLPALALVAVEPSAEEVIGHVVCTRGSVEGRPALGLGPLAVRPDRQRRGVGAALMHAVLGAADALGEPLVALLGEPSYYGRFGFRASSEYGILPPDRNWQEHFQVRTLSAYRPLSGTFAYAEPFNRL